MLDATNLIRPGTDNALSLRVLNPDNQPIDGIVLPETPHRNKVVKFSPGNSFDYGGILLPVELLLTPSIRIASLHLRPDWETGIVRIDCELNNETRRTHTAQVDFSILRTTMDEPLLVETKSFTVAADNSTVHHEIRVAHHRLWQLDDPCLYRLQARLKPAEGEDVHEASSCFGFRDFRVVDGYFRLNGRRIFLKSTHTGNHGPFGQVVPTPGYPDLQAAAMRHSGHDCTQHFHHAGQGSAFVTVVDEFATAVLIAAGTDPAAARSVAGALTETSLRGVDSHGIRLLMHYAKVVQAGRINSRPRLTFTRTDRSTGTVDADNAFGQHASYFPRGAVDLGALGAGKLGIRRQHFWRR